MKKNHDNKGETASLTPQQRQFLHNYAISLDARQSAKKAGYKAPGGITQAEKMLLRPFYLEQLDAIIEEKAAKYDICKAYAVKKYLEIINLAISPKNPEKPTTDAALALRAVDSMARTLGIFSPENSTQEGCSALKDILGLDVSKV
jgi:hypothetical protein